MSIFLLFFCLTGAYSPPGAPHMQPHYGGLRPPSHMPQMLLPPHHAMMDGYGNMAMHGAGLADIHAG